MAEVDVPHTPAGEQVIWLIGAVRQARDGLLPSEEEQDRFTEPWHGTEEGLRQWWLDYGQRIGDGVIVGVEDRSPTEIEVCLEAAGRRWAIDCVVQDDPPHRIRFMRIRPTLAGLVVRLATEDDAVAMVECELQCPMVLGDRRIYVDRGSDWFAANRIVGDAAAVAVGEIGGRILGIYGAVVLSMRIGGQVYHRFSPRHLRMLPETQGTGIWRSLTGPTFAALEGRFDGSVSFISPFNAATQRTHATAPNKWTVQAVRAVIDVARQAGPASGRPAGPEDADFIVDVVNACHRDEEGYIPYTAESLRERLSRAPHLYSWERVWVTDGAVVGVWPTGLTTRWIIEEGDRQTEQRRALVVDFGFLPSAEDEFEALLRAWCSWCAERGLTHLTTFTSQGSPGYSRLASLADDMEPFDMWTHDIAEPQGARERGLYIDQLFF